MVIDELANYDGIGPGTTAKLREFGVRNLAQLRRFNPMTIPGIGDKRGGDIRRAERQLEARVRGQFERRELPVVRDLDATLRAIRRQGEEQKVRAQARIQAVEKVLREVNAAAALAEQISFFRWLAGKATATVPPEMLGIPQLNLDAELRAAEAAALSNWRPTSEPEVAPAREPEPPRLPSEDKPPRQAVQSRPRAAPPQAQLSPEEKKAQLLEAGVALGMVVARAHGRVTRAERQVLEDFVAQHSAGDAALANKGRGRLAFYEGGAIDLKEQLLGVERISTPAERQQLYDLARAVAATSNDIDPEEVVILDRIAAQWKLAVVESAPVSRPQPPPAPSPPPTAVADPRATLEIAPDVKLSPELIRRQHRQLMERYDPAKVERLGAEFVAIARSKRAAVQAAAQNLIAPFAEPLELPDAPPPPAEMRHNPDLDALFG